MADNYSLVANGHAQKTTAALTTDVQTFAQPGNARAFLIQVSGQDVYATFDGTAPSSTNGIPIPKNGLPAFFPVSAPSIKVAPTAATSAIVNVVWVAG